jgi:exopolyphosphatase/guanosine-5'-triphosphate,3'-diphosphate pyrophosphatase
MLPERMRIASIDIGTNTVLLLVADIGDDGTIVPVRYDQRIPRLGKDVDARRRLAEDAIQRVIHVLTEYQSLLAPLDVTATVLTATSAVRDAGNRAKFLEEVHRATGWRVQILSGSEEARWAYRGAISGVLSAGRTSVLDIGGGSTEVISGVAGTLTHRRSLNIGALRITERFLQHDPPSATEVAAAERFVRSELRAVDSFPLQDSTVVGVAGTATTLALLAQGYTTFDIRGVSGYRLPLDEVIALERRMEGVSTMTIGEWASVLEGRADIIRAGTIILREFLSRYGFPSIIVSERGLRYGIVLREWERLNTRNHQSPGGRSAMT